jgi:hypothetical protein
MSSGGRVWTRRCGRHLSGGADQAQGSDPARLQDSQVDLRHRVVVDYSHIGEGQGGWHEDNQYYGTEAGI